MKSILRTSAFIFAAIMFASSVSESVAYQKSFADQNVNVLDAVQSGSSDTGITEHIEFYNKNKSEFDIRSESLDKLIGMANQDNTDNTFETLNIVGKKANVDVSKFSWNDSIASEVVITEIMMSGDFINASARAYQNEYNAIVNGLLAEVRKSNSNADRNSIYKMSADSFNTYMRSCGLTSTNLTQIKTAYPGTNDYYNNCVAFAAYKKSRTIITQTLSVCSEYTKGDDSAAYAKLLNEIAESFTATAFSAFQKAGVTPLINSDISIAQSEKIVTSCISQLVNGNCMMLSALMVSAKLSLHKDMNFFGEILDKYDCQIKSRAEERELFKSAYLVYRGAASAMADKDGFISDVISKGDNTSLDIFESGMAFYKKSVLLTLGHAEQYAVVKSVKDNEFETQSLETYALLEANKIKKMVCHGEGSSLNTADAYNAFTVSGPVNITVFNGEEKAAEITGGKVAVYDKTNLMGLNIIQLSEDEKNPAKTLVIPSEFTIKISATGDGNMTLSNVMSQEGQTDISSLFSKIPVKNQNQFELDMDKYILKNISENISYPDEIKKEIPEDDILKGDVDNDGIVNAKDLVYLHKCILSPDTVIMPGSDINGDGKTDSLDMVQLKNLFLG